MVIRRGSALPPNPVVQTHATIPISSGWQFKKTTDDDSTYRPVSRFPTDIHLDLLHHNLIADPHIGRQELDSRWVDECAWTYRVTFSAASPASSSSPTSSSLAPFSQLSGARADLVFDGLDTFATVQLNGSEVLRSENMFIGHRMDVRPWLHDGDNELVITFDSAYRRGWGLVDEHKSHRWVESNGDHSRLPVRKAQYHWGWDWGPILTTCGPWRPVHLEVYRSRISSLWCDVDLNEAMTGASINCQVDTVGPSSRIVIRISGPAGALWTAETEIDAGGTGRSSLTIEDPQLWYPAGYGSQPLYSVCAILLGPGGDALHEQTRRIGIRQVRLIQRPLATEPGTSFFFQVNGIAVFCGGSNWIPADSFIPRLSRERYFEWVRLLVAGNQVMLRVWGGGIYEEAHLYEACDELGVLVWQDFMFACGNYPAWPAFLRSVEAEARYNLDRLRHHPSIVIWAGNNEDYQIAEDEGLDYDPADVTGDPQRWLQTNFPARYIYEKLLPDVCRQIVPDTYYHPGSPWGGVDAKDPTVGDIHQWNIWHGSQKRYQDAEQLVGRFVSEFGMQAFPAVRTIDSYLPRGQADPERYAQSATVDFHNKATGHERRLALYLADNVRWSAEPMEDYVYATQLMQAECLGSAYRLWRRQWRGPGHEHCGGVLVWQLNDCWPCTSWSLCDFFLRPKHAYYAVKRELARLTVGTVRREERHSSGDWPHSRVDVDVETRVEIWASNLVPDSISGVDYVIRGWDAETGNRVLCETVAADLCLPATRSTEIGTVTLRCPEPGQTVVAVYLVRDGDQIARAVNWPEPLKHVRLATPQRLLAVLRPAASVVELSCEVPVKGVALECDDDAVVLDDNLLDVVPGEVLQVGVRGATVDTRFRTRYMGMSAARCSGT